MMPPVLLRLLPYGVAALLAVAVVAGIYTAGRNHERAIWQARAAEAQRAADADRRLAETRLDALVDAVEFLEARPERIRVITKEIVRHVQADRDCPSLPADWRRLWNAAGDDPAPAPAPGVADEPRPAMAEPRGN